MSNVRYGYACINTQLRAQGVYCSRTCRKATFQSGGLDHISQLTLDNVLDLQTIVRWNESHGIRVFRISSDLVPWGSEFDLQQLPDLHRIHDILIQVGSYAQQHGHRLSFHPGQFNCLGSPNLAVIDNSIRDLELHGQLMDLLGMPDSPQAKINIHLGGTYGDKQSAMDRFCSSFERLSPSVQSRLTVENDDKANCYSVQDLYTVHQRLGIPIVFDYHHHRFCPGDLSEQQALELAASTWSGITPTCHYSESDPNKPNPRSHSQLVAGPINTYGLDLDVVIEAKLKEQAVLGLRVNGDADDVQYKLTARENENSYTHP